MTLAAFADANNHLDQEKVKFANADAAGDISEGVDRYIRSRIAGLYGDQILLWDVNPTPPQVQTPELIREVASMLMAARLYSTKYSLEDNTTNTYATRLRREAEELLDGIAEGSLVLVEAEILSGTSFSEDDFWPNDTTGIDSCVNDPKFSMSDDL